MPSFTKTWHNDTYPALTANLPSLSGKTAVITGGAGLLGRAIATSLVQGGAKVIILGRTESTLRSAVAQISEKTGTSQMSYLVADVLDEQSIQAALVQAATTANGTIDILINNAGYVAPGPGLTKLSDPAFSFHEYGHTYAVNLRGSMNALRFWLPHRPSSPRGAGAKKQGGTCINISALIAVGHASTVHRAGLSAYAGSKLAAAKMFEHVAVEEASTGLNVVNVQPGIVEGDMTAKVGGVPAEMLDTPQLPGDFVRWLCSAAEAEFLGDGRFVCANWDVDELVARREEVVKGHLLFLGLNGWP